MYFWILCEFGEMCVCESNNIFYDAVFNQDCKFYNHNRFYGNIKFGEGCKFGNLNEFGDNVVFGRKCKIGKHNQLSFGAWLTYHFPAIA